MSFYMQLHLRISRMNLIFVVFLRVLRGSNFLLAVTKGRNVFYGVSDPLF